MVFHHGVLSFRIPVYVLLFSLRKAPCSVLAEASEGRTGFEEGWSFVRVFFLLGFQHTCSCSLPPEAPCVLRMVLIEPCPQAGGSQLIYLTHHLADLLARQALEK